MVVSPIKTRLFLQGENLAAFILDHMNDVREGDVVVVTSKIMSLAENRAVDVKTPQDRETYVRQESELAVKTPYTTMTLREGMIMASAGVDESNADGKLILLPKDVYGSCHALWLDLKKTWGLKSFGLIITDSRTLVLRRGSVGMAIAHAGFHAIKSYVGSEDLFGRVLHVSRANTADPLASAAVHTMGEGRERQPLALIRGAELLFTDEKIGREDIQVEMKDDVYGPLFQKVLGDSVQELNEKYLQDIAHKDGTDEKK
jgi:F420-0:gamma-glutamyl ligase